MKTVIDYIDVYRKEVEPDLCDLIVETVATAKHWQQAKVGTGDTLSDYRNCSDLNLASHPELDSAIYRVVGRAMGYYRSNHPHVDVTQDTGYNVLRYETGSFYKEHVDSFKGNLRTVSCSMVLNDEFEGGEFAFFDGSQVYALGKGDILMFPSNFMYPHQVMPVTKGTRYSIVTWLN